MRLLACAVVFLLVDPALDADDAIQGTSFGKTVVERNTESLERHLAFAISFSTGDVSATKTASTTETNSFGTEFHGGLECTLHRTAETNTALKLNGNLLSDQLGVELRLANFDDVDFDLGTLAEAGNIFGHHLDFLALATDDQPGT